MPAFLLWLPWQVAWRGQGRGEGITVGEERFPGDLEAATGAAGVDVADLAAAPLAHGADRCFREDRGAEAVGDFRHLDFGAEAVAALWHAFDLDRDEERLRHRHRLVSVGDQGGEPPGGRSVEERDGRGDDE